MGLPPPIYRHLGTRVRELREIRKLSQAQLAEAIDRGADYVGRIERGEKRIQIEDLAKAAVALDVTLGELFRGIQARPALHRAKGARERAARYESASFAPPSTDELAALLHLAGALDEDDVAALIAVARRMLAGELRRR